MKNQIWFWLLVLAISLGLGIWSLGFWIGGCASTQELPTTTSTTTTTSTSTSTTTTTAVPGVVDYSLLYRIDGPDNYGGFGTAVSPAGDINGDGKIDFLIGAPHVIISGKTDVGKAFIYSGADGVSILWQKDGASEDPKFNNYENYGFSLASLDDAFVVSAQWANHSTVEAGSVYVYSKSTGNLLYRLDGGSIEHHAFGSSVAAIGDLNGDGRQDFVVGSHNADPSAEIFSGADGSRLLAITGDWYSYFGFSVSSAGDVNHDGKPDFIVGAPGAMTETGSALVYSGADGSPLYKKIGTRGGQTLGWSVSGAGDLNGDSKADFIVGAGGTAGFGHNGSGEVHVYSGADGSQLLPALTGEDPDDYSFGMAVKSIGDVNGDGKPDIIVGAPYRDRQFLDPTGTIRLAPDKYEAGAVYIFSGADGSLLWKRYGDNEYDHFGAAIAVLGDINGNGKPDLMIGAPSIYNRRNGSVYIFVSQ